MVPNIRSLIDPLHRARTPLIAPGKKLLGPQPRIFPPSGVSSTNVTVTPTAPTTSGEVTWQFNNTTNGTITVVLFRGMATPGFQPYYYGNSFWPVYNVWSH